MLNVLLLWPFISLDVMYVIETQTWLFAARFNLEKFSSMTKRNPMIILVVS